MMACMHHNSKRAKIQNYENCIVCSIPNKEKMNSLGVWINEQKKCIVSIRFIFSHYFIVALN